MMRELAYLLFIAVVSGNPAADKPWYWTFSRPLVTPTGTLAGSIRSSRIVGGVEAVPHSWPHQVGLFIDDLFFCGGSLISNEWVLTAAHCMDGADFVEVVMGAHNIKRNEPWQLTANSTDFFTHEDWNATMLTNDIALIRLPFFVTFNSYINSIRLPSSAIGTGQVVVATGWGIYSNDESAISPVLREVQLTIISNAACREAYHYYIHPYVVCSDGSPGKGTCNGDSGSPINKDGEIHGITSFGAAVGCAVGFPDAFTRIYHYLDWIHDKTGITP
ncbi:brachyurin-like [Scylla paramamosain]|uniref:brachyurin-like n=1 Tax=Scylla paramamosain TaxID=85552 RepID=UPI003082FC5C